MSTLTINEGFNPNTGVATRTHFEDGNIVVQKTFDATPHLQHVQQLRESYEGQRWGEGKIVGHLPPAFHAEVLLIRDPDERKRRVQQILQQNPDFVTYAPYLKAVRK